MLRLQQKAATSAVDNAAVTDEDYFCDQENDNGRYNY